MVRSNTGKNNKLIIFWTGAIDNDVWGNNENFHCRGATLVGHKTNHKKIISCPNWPRQTPTWYGLTVRRHMKERLSYRLTAQYWIVSSVAGLPVKTWCLLSPAPFLKWQTDFSRPRLSYLSAYSGSSTILFISCPSDCNLGNPYLGMWPLKLLWNLEDEAWQRKMNYFLHCCLSFRRFQLCVLS